MAMTNPKIQQFLRQLENDDLDQLLEAELAKPAEEIDSDLIDRILDVLGVPEPTPEQVEASWQIIKARVLKNYG